MDVNDIRRAKLKKAAQLRAAFAYNQALERIDYRIDTVETELDKIDFNALNGELPVILPIDIDEFKTVNS